MRKGSPYRGFSRNLDLAAPVHSQKWLGPGSHDVTIEDVDTTNIDGGKITITFRDDNGAVFKNSIFMTERGKPHKPSRVLLAFICGVLPQIDAQTMVLNALADDRLYSQILDTFRGMTCRIKIEWGSGYRLEWSDENAAYILWLDGDELYESRSIREAKEWAESQGYKRAYRRLTQVEAIDEDHEQQNIDALRLAVTSLKQAQASEDPDECQFA